MIDPHEDPVRSGAYDTPQALENRPGLTQLRYRAGTYTSFRNTMLRRITQIRVKIDDSLADGTPNNEIVPLRLWSARDSDDYGIALLELWAYVADILTFYQERIANEAFIRTASLRASLMRLAALLDYHPAPGVAASVYLVFTMKDGTTAQLRAGLPVQHVPVGDEPPQKFETSQELAAVAQWNQLMPLPETPETLRFRRGDAEAYLAGTRVAIAPGDWVLIVGETRTEEVVGTADTSERFEIRQVVAVERLADTGETRVVFERTLGTSTMVVEEEAEFFVFRGKATLFGADAPDWRIIPTDLRNQFLDSSPIPAERIIVEPVQTDWPNQEGNTVRRIDLNREYPTILPDSWIVLLTSNCREAYQVVSTDTTARTDYTLRGQVTRLVVDTDENFSEFGLASNDPFHEVRNTVVLHTGERLPVAERFTPIPIEGSTIDVVEDVSTLAGGRQILIFGPTEPGGASKGEVAIVREVVGDGHTLSLESPLQASYFRAETAIFANVVVATHGETVADEILGSGDAAVSFQSFELKQSPLTFVQQAGASGGAASTLELRINGILWHEAPTFYSRGGDEAIFTTEITDDQTTIVRLGDGITGARSSTGRNNVTATYRKGIGSVGNLPGGVIKTPLQRPKGLTSAHNPLASSGGTDSESPDQIRQSAPNTVRTFGRIVSLRDFEAAAREFAGVAKARAFLDWDEETRLVKLIVAGEQGAEIVNPQFQMLVDDLDSRCDPNRKLLVLNSCPVDLQLWLTVYPHVDYLLEAVESNVRGALDAFFAFDRLALGQSIALSEIDYVLHQAPGVVGIQINRLRALPATTPCAAVRSFPFRLAGDLVQQVVPVAPYELARLDTTALDRFQIQWGEPA